jgi:hypothetical protein
MNGSWWVPSMVTVAILAAAGCAIHFALILRERAAGKKNCKHGMTYTTVSSGQKRCCECGTVVAPQLPYLGPWCCDDGMREKRPICDGCRNILDLYNMEGIESVKVLSLREGDTLVVRCTDDIDWETAQRLRDMVKAIAKWEKVLVLGPQLQVEVLRPE